MTACKIIYIYYRNKAIDRAGLAIESVYYTEGGAMDITIRYLKVGASVLDKRPLSGREALRVTRLGYHTSEFPECNL